MINKVLTVLKDKLNNADLIKDSVVIADVSKHDDGTSNLSDKVIITLLNIQEEATMKNTPRYDKKKVSNSPVRYEMKTGTDDPAYVNLYVIISANKTYEIALANISKVIEVIHANNVMTYEVPGKEEENFNFRIDMHSIPFEQLSYVWGLLGGKIMPSVLYKISVVKIAELLKNPIELPLIDEVTLQSNALENSNG